MRILQFLPSLHVLIITDKVISSLSVAPLVDAGVLSFLGRNCRADRTVQDVGDDIFLIWLLWRLRWRRVRVRAGVESFVFGGRGLLLVVGLAGVVTQWPWPENSSCIAELTTETATPLQKGVLSERRQENRACPHVVFLQTAVCCSAILSSSRPPTISAEVS